MKRYILVMVDSDGTGTISIQTDDVLATVESIIEVGYDLGDDDAAAINHTLLADSCWPSEDGSRSLILIDTQAIDCDTTAG